MKNYLLGVAAASLMIGAAGTAQAASIIAVNNSCNTDGRQSFCVDGDAQAPGVDDFISATISNSFRGNTNFDDTYSFIIDKNGIGSGGLQTSFATEANFVNITDLIINNVSYASSIVSTPAGQSASVNGIKIIAGALNSIRVVGSFMPSTPAGAGNYTGNLTFSASAVPEASTWAMMMLGMGAVGFGMRRRRKASSSARVTFA
ncbi:FxDxF family PEP-CTERM protein [Sphingomonas xinjiangensis]|uniref:Ice-binding protein C-terminal domain-containing protein n=1 Tax=Sphingomonas xinjiangensis TaxID=643568 RepID=A0A840YIB9_9SPHN|nr:FxDxF family PEP-CTERM protein [Sphingomonas xinjiangensis]MBB5712175.1 hypothetical protein [Sphingomonas xinjiangensis]